MVAKGKLFIGRGELEKLFNLPVGVEILAIRPRESEDGFEFLVVSAEETRITNSQPLCTQRRTHVPLELIPQERKEKLVEKFEEQKQQTNHINISIYKQKETDIQDIMKEISENLRNTIGR